MNKQANMTLSKIIYSVYASPLAEENNDHVIDPTDPIQPTPQKTPAPSPSPKASSRKKRPLKRAKALNRVLLSKLWRQRRYEYKSLIN